MHSHLKPIKKMPIIIISVLLSLLLALGAVIIIVEHLRNKTDTAADIFSSSTPQFTSSDNSDSDYSTQDTETSTEITSSKAPVESVYIPPASKIETVSKPKQTASNTASLKQQIDSVKQTEENTVQVKTTVKSDHLKKKKVRLAVKHLPQNPELPTGCEITALTTVLNYYGFNVDKLTMATKYLEKADAPANFWKVFLGDPTKKTGFGCYAAPITNAANKYLKDIKANYVAKNVSGTSFEKLLSYVENGTPVVIWGTMEMKKPYSTYKWTVDGETVQWIAPEHCLVLIGYDIENGTAIVSDPQKGIGSYKLDTVKARFLALHSQCVILEKTKNDDLESASSNTDSSSSINSGSSEEESSSLDGNSSDESNSSADTSSPDENSSSNDSSSEESSSSSDNNSSEGDGSSENNSSSANSNSSEENNSSENGSTN